MNKVLKNTLILVFVPSLAAGAYYGYIFIERRVKLKKAIGFVEAAYDGLDKNHKANEPTNMKSVFLTEWETAFKNISNDAFKAFYDFLSVTLPLGKDKESKKWKYEVTNAADYEKKRSALDKYSVELNTDTKLMEYFSHLAEKI